MAHEDAVMRALIRADREVDRAIRSAGESIVQEFRRKLSTPYPPASAPGNVPHMRTGRYRSGIFVRVRGNTIEIYTSNPLAVWLEYGTHRDGRPYMAPRPHWRTHLPIIIAKHIPLTIGKAIIEGEEKHG